MDSRIKPGDCNAVGDSCVRHKSQQHPGATRPPKGFYSVRRSVVILLPPFYSLSSRIILHTRAEATARRPEV